MTKFDAAGLSSLFSADSKFDVDSLLFSFLYCDFDKFSYTSLVKDLEGVEFKDSLFDVIWDEFSNIISAKTRGHLGKVICSKAEEFCFFCYAVCS